MGFFFVFDSLIVFQADLELKQSSWQPASQVAGNRVWHILSSHILWSSLHYSALSLYIPSQGRISPFQASYLRSNQKHSCLL
jgi:hypothetical protein